MPLTPPSQVLMRNRDALVGSRILVCDAPSGEIGPELRRLLPAAEITLLQTVYGDYLQTRQWSEDAGANAIFGAWYDGPPAHHDLAVVYLPKSRAALELALDMVSRTLGPGHSALLVGPVRGGIKSCQEVLRRRIGPTQKLDSARRCALYAASLDQSKTGDSELEDWVERFSFRVGDQLLEVSSLPGVFSHGRLDEGTRILLKTLDNVPGGSILDFGCGCGVIGAWIQSKSPQTRLEMVDSSALALEAAKRTAALHGIPAECVYPSDVFSDVRGKYDLIVSNPPFHTGVDTDYTVVESFLEGAAARLARGGSLRLVANRFLRYPPLITTHIGPCRVLAEDSRYRVYQATAGPGRPR